MISTVDIGSCAPGVRGARTRTMENLEHEWLAANPVEGQLNPSASLLPECGNNMPFLELFDKRT